MFYYMSVIDLVYVLGYNFYYYSCFGDWVLIEMMLLRKFLDYILIDDI